MTGSALPERFPKMRVRVAVTRTDAFGPKLTLEEVEGFDPGVPGLAVTRDVSIWESLDSWGITHVPSGLAIVTHIDSLPVAMAICPFLVAVNWTLPESELVRDDTARQIVRRVRSAVRTYYNLDRALRASLSATEFVLIWTAMAAAEGGNDPEDRQASVRADRAERTEAALRDLCEAVERLYAPDSTGQTLVSVRTPSLLRALDRARGVLQGSGRQ